MIDMPYFWVAEWLIRLVMAVVIVLRQQSPTTALAWLVVVGFLPIPGALAYLLIGENRLGRKQVALYANIAEHVGANEAARGRIRDIFVQPPPRPLDVVATLAEAVGASPLLGGNDLQLLSQTHEALERLIGDIDAATDHCHLLYYIFNDDPGAADVAAALTHAAARGVTCRLMADAVGSKAFLKSEVCHALQTAGVCVIAVMPVNPMRAAVARIDLRNHRKLAVIDGAVAYTGSHNVSGPIYPRKSRYGAWVDASVRLTGPAVHWLQQTFCQDWAFNVGQQLDARSLFPPYSAPPGAASPVQVLPTGPTSAGAPLLDVTVQAIQVSMLRVVFTTPYFVPHERILAAMRSAALRGVEVVLVVPKHSDNMIAAAAGRSHYGHLLDEGVQIHEYTAGLLHAKTLTIDRHFAVIGSANLDVRSFMLNFEMALLVYDSDFASQLHFLQTSYLNQSEPVQRETWNRRGPVRVFADNIAKLATPLL